MIREIIYLATFEKNWKALGLSDSDLAELEKILIAQPDVGKIIEGTGGLRKMRFALPHRGKSGSARILYIDFAYYEKLFLFNTYAKSEKESLTDKEKAILKKAVTTLETELKRS